MGYNDFLENIGSKQRKEALDWYGRPYDPDDIDEQQISFISKALAAASPEVAKP